MTSAWAGGGDSVLSSRSYSTPSRLYPSADVSMAARPHSWPSAAAPLPLPFAPDAEEPKAAPRRQMPTHTRAT